jgi:hypothetical protein
MIVEALPVDILQVMGSSVIKLSPGTTTLCFLSILSLCMMSSLRTMATSYQTKDKPFNLEMGKSRQSKKNKARIFSVLNLRIIIPMNFMSHELCFHTFTTVTYYIYVSFHTGYHMNSYLS